MTRVANHFDIQVIIVPSMLQLDYVMLHDEVMLPAYEAPPARSPLHSIRCAANFEVRFSTPSNHLDCRPLYHQCEPTCRVTFCEPSVSSVKRNGSPYRHPFKDHLFS